MKKSMTFRRRAPEGTTFVTIVVDSSGSPNTLLVNIGKAGGHLNAAADGMARLAGAAFRAGADPRRVARITRGIKHDRSNGDFEASSLADAVAQSLEAFAEITELAEPEPID